MPRIEAATVAEHREMRRRAVVENARLLLLSGGPAAVTPAAVAEKTGLARSSVYQYFATSGELIGAAFEELFGRHTTRLLAAVERAGPDPRDRLAAYVRTSLATASEGHSPTVGGRDLPEACRARLQELHDRAATPLRQIVLEWSEEDVDARTGLALGTLQGAVVLVDHGEPVERVAEQTIGFLTAALTG